MNIVLSIGGSLLTSDFTAENFKRYAEVIKKISKSNRVIAVIGGGKPARDYISVSRGLKSKEEVQDEYAIEITRLNARLFSDALGSYAAGGIKNTYADIEAQYRSTNKIVVCGGIRPGQSTDGVAAELAKRIKANLVINSSNAAVHEEDPKKNPAAKKLNTLTYAGLRKILEGNSQSPGKYGLFDVAAVEVLEKECIPLIIIDATDPDEILRAIKGKHSGTVIE